METATTYIMDVYSKQEIDDMFIKKNDSDTGYVRQEDLNLNYLTKEQIEASYALKQTLADEYVAKSYSEGTYATKAQLAADYFTKGEIESKYLEKTQGEEVYAKKEEVATVYVTKGQLTTDYFTRGQIEASYLTKAEIEASFVTKSQLDDGYPSKTYLETNYLTKEQTKSEFLSNGYIVANPTEQGNITVLNKIKIGNSIYEVSAGSGGGGNDNPFPGIDGVSQTPATSETTKLITSAGVANMVNTKIQPYINDSLSKVKTYQHNIYILITGTVNGVANSDFTMKLNILLNSISNEKVDKKEKLQAIMETAVDSENGYIPMSGSIEGGNMPYSLLPSSLKVDLGNHTTVIICNKIEFKDNKFIATEYAMNGGNETITIKEMKDAVREVSKAYV